MNRLMRKIKYRIDIILIKKYWKKKNGHNGTSLGIISNPEFIQFVKAEGVTVGKNTYGRLNLNYSGNKEERIVIGSNCSIAGSSNFLLGGEHIYDSITTFPYAFRVFKEPNDVKTKGPIIVEDEVWIGDGTWILSGVRIGKGAIVAAGAVVTKNVPPYAIVAGCPAKVIKYRFSEKIIDKIYGIDLASMNFTEDKLQYLSMPLTDENVDSVIEKLGIKLHE